MTSTLVLAVLLLPAVFTTTTTTTSNTITQCTKDGSTCGCKTDQGTISLDKYSDQPFTATDTMTYNTYIWSPCKDISKGGMLPVTASCIQQVSDDEYYDCGTFASLQTSVDNTGDAQFNMDASDNMRHSSIKCVCKPNAVDTFSFDGEDPPMQGIYDMSLTGDSCCPKNSPGPGPSGSGGSGGGLSVGSILLIIVLVVLVVYLVVGVVVQTTVRKAEGKERIPNVALWAAIPGLVRDGVRFTCSCGKSRTYDQI